MTYEAVATSAADSRERTLQLAADRRLVAELDEARLQGAAVKDAHFDWDSKLAAYAAAFRKAGVDPENQPAGEIVARLKPKRDIQRIAAALDDWAWHEGTKERRDLLDTVAGAIDPERNPLRSAIRKRDRAVLAAMARAPTNREMPANTACLLARVLGNLGSRDDAIAVLAAARAGSPADFWINHDLGELLSAEKKTAEAADAVRFLTVAAALKPDSPGTLVNLGAALAEQGKLDEAIAADREAIRLKPDYAEAHANLGNVLETQGKLVEAIAPYREAIRLKPDLAATHYNLGTVFAAQGKLVEAIAAYREAIRLKPDDMSTHYNLGCVLAKQGKLDEAVAAYCEAIRLKPDAAEPHCNLGGTLQVQGKLVEAIAAYREAIRLMPDFVDAHCNLGHALRLQGRYAEALAELRKGHEIGSKLADWPYPSAQWVAECEALVALEARLPALLRGDDRPKDNADRLALGQLCYDTKRFAASARFWGDALTDDPKLGDDRQAQRRYNAACSAAMAGTGGGIDDPKPDDAARAKLRDQARDWLRAELSAWKKVAMTAEPGNKPLVAKTLQHWKADADLAGVRDTEGLAKLPEAERAEWRGLWADVDALLQKVGRP